MNCFQILCLNIRKFDLNFVLRFGETLISVIREKEGCMQLFLWKVGLKLKQQYVQSEGQVKKEGSRQSHEYDFSA